MYWSRVYDLSIQKILTFLIQWFLIDLKDTNHIFIWLVILTISTFRRVWLFVLTNFMFLLQIWCIEKKSWDVNCFSDYQDGLQTDESRHQVKGKVHMCWYIRGRKNTVEVCSCGEHSIWKHSQVIIMQQSISTVFIWLDILTITEIKHQSNRYIILQLIQIYNITAYTITDTVNI